MRLLSLLAVLALIAAVAVSAISPQATAAQSPQTKPPSTPVQEQDDAIRLTSRLVLVPLSASDSSGKPVRDMKAEDFVLEEEGRPQTIISMGEP
ncbi:MAG: hypothetical protein WAV20_19045, partial [Blastocatellia bacterium]